MSLEKSEPITQLLAAAEDGNGHAAEQLWRLIYDELHRIADGQVRKEHRTGHLRPTELIHEAFFKLFQHGDDHHLNGRHFSNRRHFFAAAAEAMRCICIDDARKKGRAKRRGDGSGAPSFRRRVFFDKDPAEVLAVGDALTKLEQFDPEKAEVVKLRYFAGLTVKETADAVGASPRKVNIQWRLARAWLHRALSDGDTKLPA